MAPGLMVSAVFALALRATTGAPAESRKQVVALAPQDIRWFTPAYYTDGRPIETLGSETFVMNHSCSRVGEPCVYTDGPGP